MNKQVHPVVMAGAFLLVVAVLGFFLYHAAVPPPTPHPDPARFMAHTSAPATH